MLTPAPDLRRRATLSPCGTYRYGLTRWWGERSRTLASFIMLNPSTADGEVDDPTIRRCIGFARAWGCDGMQVVNLYALRATDPRELWQHPRPVGEGKINDAFIRMAARESAITGDPIVAAWGANARADRVDDVVRIVADAGATLTPLGVTKAGQPRHPLYLRRDAQRTPWPTADPSTQ